MYVYIIILSYNSIMVFSHIGTTGTSQSEIITERTEPCVFDK